MKLFVLSFLIFSLGAAAVIYEPNDGTHAPGSFTNAGKENPEEQTSTKKVIEDKTVEQQEEELPGTGSGTGNGQGTGDKPILDSNPNDEVYRIGPLKVPDDPKSSESLEQMEEEQEAVDFSTNPDKKVVPQKPSKTKK